MQKNYAYLHTAGTNIYLFDSIYAQDIAQISKLRNLISIAIAEAKKSTTQTLTIYVDCPDDVIDERFQPALTEIYEAVQSGIKLNVQDAGKPNSTYVRVLNSIIDVAKTPTPTNSPFRRTIKQH